MDTKSLNFQFGEFTLDVVRGCVVKAGEQIKLRPKVYETLKYLVEHPGQLKEALTRALALNKPVVVDVVSDVAAFAPHGWTPEGRHGY